MRLPSPTIPNLLSARARDQNKVSSDARAAAGRGMPVGDFLSPPPANDFPTQIANATPASLGREFTSDKAR